MERREKESIARRAYPLGRLVRVAQLHANGAGLLLLLRLRSKCRHVPYFRTVADYSGGQNIAHSCDFKLSSSWGAGAFAVALVHCTTTHRAEFAWLADRPKPTPCHPTTQPPCAYIIQNMHNHPVEPLDAITSCHTLALQHFLAMLCKRLLLLLLLLISAHLAAPFGGCLAFLGVGLQSICVWQSYRARYAFLVLHFLFCGRHNTLASEQLTGLTDPPIRLASGGAQCANARSKVQ